MQWLLQLSLVFHGHFSLNVKWRIFRPNLREIIPRPWKSCYIDVGLDSIRRRLRNFYGMGSSVLGKEDWRFQVLWLGLQNYSFYRDYWFHSCWDLSPLQCGKLWSGNFSFILVCLYYLHDWCGLCWFLWIEFSISHLILIPCPRAFDWNFSCSFRQSVFFPIPFN